MIKKALLYTIALVSLLILALFMTTIIRPSADGLSDYLVKPITSIPVSDLKVKFLGNTNLLFSDGETHILTDGFFSRPGIIEVLGDELSPDKDLIAATLSRAGIKELDALIPVHSHFDHAMDVGPVAELTGATLIGSSSSINIGRGYGLPESQMKIPPLNTPIQLGDFKLTFIASKHWHYPDADMRSKLLDQDIESPLTTPASVYDYKEGISYTILVEHGSMRFAIQGSAGYRQESISGFDADVLFLSISGLESMDDAYNSDFQAHVIEALDPEVLVPIHWDDFTLPLENGLKPTSLLFRWTNGGNIAKAFDIIEERNLPLNRDIKVLPLWEWVSMSDLIL